MNAPDGQKRANQAAPVRSLFRIWGLQSLVTGILGVLVLFHVVMAYRHDWLVNAARLELVAGNTAQADAMLQTCRTMLDGPARLLAMLGRDCGGGRTP
jgi:hypothetical protein